MSAMRPDMSAGPMPRGVVGAADIDLGARLIGPTAADPWEEVTFTVRYSNNGDDFPSQAISHLYLPPGAFLDESDYFYSLMLYTFSDSRSNGVVDGAITLRSTCDQMMMAVYNLGTRTLDVPGGAAGQYRTTIQMPMAAPKVTKLVISEPASVAGEYHFRQGECRDCVDPAGVSCMGMPPGLIDPPLSAELVLAEPADGCVNLTNWNDVAGKIAVIDRGNCEFGYKALSAEVAGAVATLIINDRASDDPDDSLPVGPWGGIIGLDVNNLGLVASGPVLYISKEDGDPIKAAIAQGRTVASIGRVVSNQLVFSADVEHYTIGPDWDTNETNDHSALTTVLNVDVDLIFGDDFEFGTTFIWSDTEP
jgi:hypothetical protein